MSPNPVVEMVVTTWKKLMHQINNLELHIIYAFSISPLK